MFSLLFMTLSREGRLQQSRGIEVFKGQIAVSGPGKRAAKEDCKFLNNPEAYFFDTWTYFDGYADE